MTFNSPVYDSSIIPGELSTIKLSLAANPDREHIIPHVSSGNFMERPVSIVLDSNEGISTSLSDFRSIPASVL